MKQKAKILMLLTYICLVWAMTEGVWNENIWNIFATYLKSIVFFFGWSCLMFGMEHIGQSFWYGIHGYGVTPVIFFPFILGSDKKKGIRIFWNVFKQMLKYYPFKLYEKYPGEEEKIESVCERAQITGIIFQSTFSIFCGIFLVFIWKKSILFLIAAGLFTISYLAIGMVES